MSPDIRTGNGKPGVDEQLPDRMLPLPFRPWPETGFQPWRSLMTGALLGGVAGCVSLMLNVIGSVVWPTINDQSQHPLRLIQVFLTFPLGESALQLNGGLTLALGCLLFLATGALYGAAFELALSYCLPHATFRARLVWFTVLALAVWVVNFYGILSWLQPLLFGGRWIMSTIPWWVAAATHLCFGWTMALIYPFSVRQQK